MPRPIRFTSHALESMAKRGATEADVTQAINERAWHPARADRFECARDFDYNDVWNGKFYRTRQVVPVFIEEPENIVVITVYVFYL